MISPTSALLPPFLLIVCIPFAVFALITSIIAFSALAVRVLALYVELGLVIVDNYLFHNDANIRATPQLLSGSRSRMRFTETSTKPRVSKQRQSRRRTLSGSPSGLHAGSWRRRLSVPDSHVPPLATAPLPSASFGGGQTPADITLARDFEGVGGWRFTGPTDEDNVWTSMNSRLELPAAPDRHRRHRRSRTSGSEPGLYLPSQRIDPRLMNPQTPPAVSRADESSAASPQGYFALSAVPKSRGLDQQVQDSREEKEPVVTGRRPSSSASSTSLVSTSSRGSHLLMKSSSNI